MKSHESAFIFLELFIERLQEVCFFLNLKSDHTVLNKDFSKAIALTRLSLSLSRVKPSISL